MVCHSLPQQFLIYGYESLIRVRVTAWDDGTGLLCSTTTGAGENVFAQVEDVL